MDRKVIDLLVLDLTTLTSCLDEVPQHWATEWFLQKDQESGERVGGQLGFRLLQDVNKLEFYLLVTVPVF